MMLALISFCVTVATLCLGAPPANAVSEFRRQLPLQAGSQVYFQGGLACTVGAVLRRSGMVYMLSSYNNAIRYIVTARHCGNENASVYVGEQGEVGRVLWESPDVDLEISRIEPIRRNQYQCDPSSVLHRCTVGVYYTPRAVGNIFLRDETNIVQSMPVPRINVPGDTETFCTSGAVSGVICTWNSAPLPGGLGFGPGEVGARTYLHHVLPGDSGGPVARTDGQLFGIIARMGDADGPTPDLMSYVPIGRLFDEQPLYQLAPPA